MFVLPVTWPKTFRKPEVPRLSNPYLRLSTQAWVPRTHRSCRFWSSGNWCTSCRIAPWWEDHRGIPWIRKRGYHSWNGLERIHGKSYEHGWFGGIPILGNLQNAENMMFPHFFETFFGGLLMGVPHFQTHPNGLYTVEVLLARGTRVLSFYNLLTKWTEPSRIIYCRHTFMFQNWGTNSQTQLVTFGAQSN